MLISYTSYAMYYLCGLNVEYDLSVTNNNNKKVFKLIPHNKIFKLLLAAH